MSEKLPGFLARDADSKPDGESENGTSTESATTDAQWTDPQQEILEQQMNQTLNLWHNQMQELRHKAQCLIKTLNVLTQQMTAGDSLDPNSKSVARDILLDHVLHMLMEEEGNERQDAGRSTSKLAEDLASRYPEVEQAIQFLKKRIN